MPEDKRKIVATIDTSGSMSCRTSQKMIFGYECKSKQVVQESLQETLDLEEPYVPPKKQRFPAEELETRLNLPRGLFSYKYTLPSGHNEDSLGLWVWKACHQKSRATTNFAPTQLPA